LAHTHCISISKAATWPDNQEVNHYRVIPPI